MQRFASFDGASIAWRELGAGPPVVLLHGLFSHAEMNWLRFGHAQAVADAGFRVILPDFRAHGTSAAPHDPAAYPHDVLARDVEALVAHLELGAFDLGGYSLGARTTVRLIARGMRPRRAVLGGMGLEGIAHGLRRRDFFRDAIANPGSHAPGTGVWYAVQFARSTGTDLAAAVHLLVASGLRWTHCHACPARPAAHVVPLPRGAGSQSAKISLQNFPIANPKRDLGRFWLEPVRPLTPNCIYPVTLILIIRESG